MNWIGVELAMERISWNEIDFVKVGNAADAVGKTGLTVLRFPSGAQGGLHISGGGPAARESGVLDPTTAPTPVNALVLGGGSAFGLCASDGVMQSLEARNIGFPTAYGVVPIVCQSDIYDLSYGNPKARPTVQMAYDACERTFISTEPMSGNIGAGTGATVGKVCGMEHAMKGGIGYAAAKLGNLVVGAVVVVNAFGNVYDRHGHALGGVMDEERQHILDACQLMFDQYVGVIESKPLVGKSVIGSIGDTSLKNSNARGEAVLGMEKGNTTIGAIVTNATFNKGELTKIAMMATNGYARSIRPVGTLSDGDTIYAFSVSESDALVECDTNKGVNGNTDDHHFEIQNGLRRIAEGESTCNIEKEIVADVNVVGTLAAELMSDAIEDAMLASRVNHSEFLANIIDLHEVKI
ncbi:P1 family peptidase [Veillonella sp. 3310]|uniref:P1 family peptidase n=1 Tax=Veillonella sp. 3310 TaxID=2490956 RepID=UPI000FD66F35|nr:P1 family peptidase [Veillonella sp. 3310]